MEERETPNVLREQIDIFRSVYFYAVQNIYGVNACACCKTVLNVLFERYRKQNSDYLIACLIGYTLTYMNFM